MRARLLVWALACAALGACAAAPRPVAGLSMPGQDERAAAGLLGSYLLARGWTVRIADTGVVEATRGAERAELRLLLADTGLDRLIAGHVYTASEGASPADLAGLARSLNETLNVGTFSVVEDGVLFESSLPFLDELDPLLLDAFLDYGADVRLAVTRVDERHRLLAPVEGPAAGR